MIAVEHAQPPRCDQLKTIWRGRDGAAKDMLKALKAGEILGILIDQDTKVQGVFVDFFGTTAWTPRAQSDLAVRTGAAVVADKGAVANWERHRDQREERDRSVRAQADATAEKLRELKLVVPVKAGERGRLFGAVTTAEIADAITELSGEKVDRRTIVVTNPIKSLGSHEVSVKLHDEVSATVALNVVPA